jgi:hypothetical protein
MASRTSKLRQRQAQEQTAETSQHLQASAAQEFGSVEELLRHDAAQITPPPAIAQRLADSTAREPSPARSWWQRWFTRSAPNP